MNSSAPDFRGTGLEIATPNLTENTEHAVRHPRRRAEGERPVGPRSQDPDAVGYRVRLDLPPGDATAGLGHVISADRKYGVVPRGGTICKQAHASRR